MRKKVTKTKITIKAILTAGFLLSLIFTSLPVQGQKPAPAKARTYLEMSEAEQDQFIKGWAQIISQFLGNNGRMLTDVLITPEAVAAIKPFVNAYAERAAAPHAGQSCQFERDNLSDVLRRWQQSRQTIRSAFEPERDLREKPDTARAEWYDTLNPRVGVYLAMVESEFCSDLQSATGLLGMFQLSQTDAVKYGLNATNQSSPPESDERRDVAKSAAAAARMLKATLNSSPGPRTENDQFIFLTALSRYYQRADSAEGYFASLPPSKKRSFWSIFPRIDRSDPNSILLKLFAAAIVIEKPEAFVDDVAR